MAFSRERGFTLMELVIVLVLAGILALAGADLILAPMQAFRETKARDQLYQEARVAMERVAAEVRTAVPNGISVPTSTTLRLVMIDQDQMALLGIYGRYLEDTDPTDNQISDVNASAPAGSVLSIYNRNWGDLNSGQRLYSVVSPGPPMQLDSAVGFQGLLHDTRRFYLVDTKAVQYSLSGTTLTRSTATVSSGGVGAFGTGVPMAKGVKGLRFRFTPGNTKRNGVLTMELSLQSDTGENVTMTQEVHVPNVP